MSFANPSGADALLGVPVAFADADVRAQFVRKTYVNLAAAVACFVALTAVLLQIPLAQDFCERMLRSPMMFLFSIGGMMVVGWIAERWAANSPSIEIQYAGLALYVVGESIFFLPILYLAQHYIHPDVIPTAGMITLVVFGGLTASVFLTGKDFSFLGPALSIVGMAAMGLIVCSFIFGFSLGLLFSVAMVVLAAGYILYYTSQVLQHYPVGMHVAAALALFAALALLFWYVLQIVIALYAED